MAYACLPLCVCLTPLGKILAVTNVARISLEREPLGVGCVSGVRNVSGATDMDGVSVMSGADESKTFEIWRLSSSEVGVTL